MNAATVPSSRTVTNPFCTRFVRPGQLRYRLSTDPAENAHALANLMDHVVQTPLAIIVGPHGTGKSTLLETICSELEQRRSDRFDTISRVRLQSSAEKSSLRKRWQLADANFGRVTDAMGQLSGPRHLLIVDGIEQLTGRHRKRLVRLTQREGHHVLATSHRDFRRFTTVYRTSSSPQMIKLLTTELIAEAPESLQHIVNRQLASHDLTKVVDVREFWFGLYDIVADQRLTTI